MSKLYKVVFIAIFSVLLIINLVFLVYNKEMVSYFGIDTPVENPQLIKEEIEGELLHDILDSRFLSDPRFVGLKEFSVDLAEFSVPGDLLGSDAEDDVDDLVEGGNALVVEDPPFEVGNDNPFRPI